jgi:alkylated DNA repair dioxygenase AlkB
MYSFYLVYILASIDNIINPMKPLPIDCKASYLANFLSTAEADSLFSEIFSGFDVTNRIVRMFDGSEHVSETGTFMFADSELTSFAALPEVWGGRAPWTESLLKVRDRVKEETGVGFQVARCVFYKDGSEGVGFHRDEPAYGSTSEIASLSLGAERQFVFRSTSNPDERFTIQLASGSLLFMGERCQELYEHALIRNQRCLEPRLNLTFRKYGWT